MDIAMTRKQARFMIIDLVPILAYQAAGDDGEMMKGTADAEGKVLDGTTTIGELTASSAHLNLSRKIEELIASSASLSAVIENQGMEMKPCTTNIIEPMTIPARHGAANGKEKTEGNGDAARMATSVTWMFMELTARRTRLNIVVENLVVKWKPGVDTIVDLALVRVFQAEANNGGERETIADTAKSAVDGTWTIEEPATSCTPLNLSRAIEELAASRARQYAEAVSTKTDMAATKWVITAGSTCMNTVVKSVRECGPKLLTVVSVRLCAETVSRNAQKKPVVVVIGGRAPVLAKRAAGPCRGINSSSG